MKVFNTVYAVDCVYCKWYSIKTLLTDHTGEATGVVGFACRTQDAVQDRIATYTTFL